MNYVFSINELVVSHQISNQQQLCDAVMTDEWFQNISESMPERIKADLNGKTGPTWY